MLSCSNQVDPTIFFLIAIKVRKEFFQHMFSYIGRYILVIVCFVVFLPLQTFSTPEYAHQTGRNCGNCHIDPTGGGSLTKDGEAFKDDLRIKGLYRVLSPFQRVIRFIIGYLHTMTGII